jgi:hypothetical protein
VTFLRVTRDQRGYETTFLLHSPRPGERPRVLYCYRTAPGVRVGRRALDEEAIRTIEEQHPDIEFDWVNLLEDAESAPPEVERRPERPRRKPPRAKENAPEETTPQPAPETAPVPAAAAPVPLPPQREQNPLLDQLVGREIATRLRARYMDIVARISETPAGDARTRWQERADALDPDRWTSAEAILEGIRYADQRFDELKRELPVAE